MKKQFLIIYFLFFAGNYNAYCTNYDNTTPLDISIDFNSQNPDSLLIVEMINQAESVINNNPLKAESILKDSYKKSQELGCYFLMIKNLELLLTFDIEKDNFKAALDKQKTLKQYQDSLNAIVVEQKLTEINEFHQTEELIKKSDILFYEEETTRLKISKSKRLTVLVVASVLILCSAAGFLFKINYDKKRANQKLEKQNILIDSQKKLLVYQKEQLQRINNEISFNIEKVQSQKVEIENKNQLLSEALEKVEKYNDEIIENMVFAKTIQSSVMSSEKELKDIFSEFELFFIPKNIVSGDFIWSVRKNGNFYLAVADSTGHGVPGALIASIGMVLLNKIIAEHDEISPAEILTKLHDAMINLFKEGNSDVLQVSESIDIALCKFDKNFEQLTFSGAKRPLLLSIDNELREIEGEKFSIGEVKKKKEVKFTNHEVKLSKPFTGFLFTDGISDQMNSKNEKIAYVKIKNFVKQKEEESLSDLNKALIDMFFKHKKSEIQTDDAIFTCFRMT